MLKVSSQAAEVDTFSERGTATMHSATTDSRKVSLAVCVTPKPYKQCPGNNTKK